MGRVVRDGDGETGMVKGGERWRRQERDGWVVSHGSSIPTATSIRTIALPLSTAIHGVVRSNAAT